MTVSIPVDVTTKRCDQPPDIRTLDDVAAYHPNGHCLSKTLQLRDNQNENVYEYSLLKCTWVSLYLSQVHTVGRLVIKDGHHYEVTGVITENNTVEVPKEPEEYSDTETDMSKFDTWTGRYFKAPIAPNGMIHNWTVGGRSYYFYWTEENNESICVRGHRWKVVDDTSDAYNPYLFSCLQPNCSFAYDPARDIKGYKSMWKAPGGTTENTLVFRSAVERGLFFYLRTWTYAPIQTKTVAAPIGDQNYTLKRIYSPIEIAGFRYKSKTQFGAAFDNKNYTQATFFPGNNKVVYSFVTTGPTDTIAIGRVMGDSVSVSARNPAGTIIFWVENYPIDNQLLDTQFGQAINVVLYSEKLIPSSSIITVRINGGYIQVGRFLMGRKLHLGFTNTKFVNGFKDFSPKEQDQWGNIEYRSGIRVFTHSGTVDMPLKNYDLFNRAFMRVGGREVIINSSDSHKNTPPNSVDIFQSTMMIGRFTSFSQQTKNIGTIMDSIAEYTFKVEESV